MKIAITETNSEQIKKKKVFKAFDNLRYQKTGWVFGFKDCETEKFFTCQTYPESRLSSSGKSQQKEKKIKTAPKIKIKAEIKTDRQEAREKSYTRSSSENN